YFSSRSRNPPDLHSFPHDALPIYPIEILHPDHNCIVNQREVGLDTESFGQALRRALRQDPDAILIGELRDAETAQTALQAAESGDRKSTRLNSSHLVISYAVLCLK